jgi:propionyl-CoA synthetase
MTGEKIEWSYKRLLHEVELFAGVLKNKGVKKGDTVIIYMPMILESAAVMLACARVGAVHSVVFGGFAPKELAGRIMDSKASLIVSASCGIEPHKVIEYRSFIREALKIVDRESTNVIYVSRESYKLEGLESTETFYHDEMKLAEP